MQRNLCKELFACRATSSPDHPGREAGPLTLRTGAGATVATIRPAVNVLVYVSDALRIDHLGCYGARFVNTRTVDEFAAGGFVFDRNYLFKDLPEANVGGTSESLDGVVEWLRENRDGPFFLYVHSWATHMPYDILHSERQDWLAAKQEVIDGIQSDSASALEAMREAYRQAVERQSEVLFASLLEELDELGLSESTVIAFTSDHGESWGERFAAKGDVKGVYHMHGATLYDEIVHLPLILSAPGRLEPAVVSSQVRSVDLVPTLLELAGLPGRETDGVSLLDVDGDRPAVIAGTDMGALTKLAVRMPPWKLILHVESGEEEAYHLETDPRERVSRPTDVPPDLRALVFSELESAERRELTEEEEATVAKRLSDLGYL